MDIAKRNGGSLRTQLIMYALAGIVLPIVISGAVAFFYLAYQLDVIGTSFVRSRDALTHEIAGTNLRAQASNAAHQLDEFLIGRIVEAKAWAAAGTVVEAARAAHPAHTAEGLTGTPIDEIEDRFRIRKSLGAFPEATTYLRQQIASSPYFVEVFFTDRNGFNVALTNPTSDFVQSDEEWWQNAWSHQLSVGEVQYDDSAGVWSIDISIRIDDPDTEEPLGVMKTVLSIEPVQQVADRTAQTIPGGRVQITTGGGVLIAETSSGHARERIMNPGTNLREQGDPSVRNAYGAETTGFASDEQWLTGYARSGGRDTYAASTQRFTGFGWLVILQRPVAGIHEPLSALREIESALRDWRGLLGLSLGLMTLVSMVLATVLATITARRITDSLAGIREMAERTSRGEIAKPPEISRPEEIVQLNEAVHRLCRVFMTVLRKSQPRQR